MAQVKPLEDLVYKPLTFSKAEPTFWVDRGVRQSCEEGSQTGPQLEHPRDLFCGLHVF